MSTVQPHYLEHTLAPAAKSGSLKVLELTIQPRSDLVVTSPSNPISVDVDEPAKDFAFAASDNIHTLGLRNFNWIGSRDDWGTIGYSFDGQPFLDWLESFPKLHTVFVYPGFYEGVDPFIMKLIAHPRVKVIHQDNLRGVSWDAAVKLAAEHGVELHHTPDHAPAGWPMIE